MCVFVIVRIDALLFLFLFLFDKPRVWVCVCNCFFFLLNFRLINTLNYWPSLYPQENSVFYVIITTVSQIFLFEILVFFFFILISNILLDNYKKNFFCYPFPLFICLSGVFVSAFSLFIYFFSFLFLKNHYHYQSHQFYYTQSGIKGWRFLTLFG